MNYKNIYNSIILKRQNNILSEYQLGSMPNSSTKNNGDIIQVVKDSVCDTEIRWFDSNISSRILKRYWCLTVSIQSFQVWGDGFESLLGDQITGRS